MRGFLLAAVLAVLVTPAMADIYDDPLHLSCATCGGDNGTFTPVLNGQKALGINVDETGTTGGINATDFLLKVLIPVNAAITVEGFSGTIGQAAFAGAANLFTSATQGTVWTTGTLEKDFLGVTSFGNGAPPNPIGAFLPSTQAVDPGATGFLVLTLDLGALLVDQQNHGVSPFSLSSLNVLPAGTWILGDACTSGTFAAGNCVDVTTAQSAALFAQPFVASTPLPATLWLFGGALALFGALKRFATRRQIGPVSILGMA